MKLRIIILIIILILMLIPSYTMAEEIDLYYILEDGEIIEFEKIDIENAQGTSLQIYNLDDEEERIIYLFERKVINGDWEDGCYDVKTFTVSTSTGFCSDAYKRRFQNISGNGKKIYIKHASGFINLKSNTHTLQDLDNLEEPGEPEELSINVITPKDGETYLSNQNHSMYELFNWNFALEEDSTYRLIQWENRGTPNSRLSFGNPLNTSYQLITQDFKYPRQGHNTLEWLLNKPGQPLEECLVIKSITYTNGEGTHEWWDSDEKFFRWLVPEITPTALDSYVFKEDILGEGIKIEWEGFNEIKILINNLELNTEILEADSIEPYTKYFAPWQVDGKYRQDTTLMANQIKVLADGELVFSASFKWNLHTKPPSPEDDPEGHEEWLKDPPTEWSPPPDWLPPGYDDISIPGLGICVPSWNQYWFPQGNTVWDSVVYYSGYLPMLLRYLSIYLVCQLQTLTVFPQTMINDVLMPFVGWIPAPIMSIIIVSMVVGIILRILNR